MLELVAFAGRGAAVGEGAGVREGAAAGEAGALYTGTWGACEGALLLVAYVLPVVCAGLHPERRNAAAHAIAKLRLTRSPRLNVCSRILPGAILARQRSQRALACAFEYLFTCE